MRRRASPPPVQAEAAPSPGHTTHWRVTHCATRRSGANVAGAASADGVELPRVAQVDEGSELPLPTLLQFGAFDRNRLRCLDAQANSSPLHAEHLERDVVVDHDLLTEFASKYQHVFSRLTSCLRRQTSDTRCP